MTEESTPLTQNSKVQFLDEEIDFDQEIENSLSHIHEMEIIKGKVINVGNDFITVDIGFKSSGNIPLEEFFDDDGNIDVKVDDIIDVYLDSKEDREGQVVLSKEKADKLRVWDDVGRLFDEGGIVTGTVYSRIKGGLSVDIGVKAFLPGSQIDLRPIRNLDKLIGERFEYKILKYNQKRGNIVLSRRALLEIDRDERRKKTLDMLQEGALVQGHVKNITEYGVFVDLGGVDGLLHITDMTWGRIVHPSEMYAVGDEIEVVILKFDQEEEKVSLGLKQKKENPWEKVLDKYPIGSRVRGKIVSLTDYGAFFEIEEGVEGLIHVSEMSWDKKARHPSKIVEMNEEVEAVVKEIDVERKRISLSMKEAQLNPWMDIAERYPVGSVVEGKIRNITDFGIFVGIDEFIDGLVHISDLSWSQRQKSPLETYKKGQDITVKILNIDVDKERLSLGIKQLTEDPWTNLDQEFPMNTDVTGKVVNITDFGIFIEIKEGVEGLVHISEIDNEVNKKTLEKFYPLNSEVRAKVIKIDVTERRLGLSIIDAPDVSINPSDMVVSEEAEVEKETVVSEEASTEVLAETETAPEETPAAEETGEEA